MHWLSLTDTEAVRENSGDTVWIHHIYPRQSDSIMCNGICAKSEIWHWQMVLVLMKCEVWNIVKLHNRARLWFLRRRDGTWPTESMNCLNTWSNFSLLWKFNKNPIHTQHWNQRFEKHLNGDKKNKKKADLDSPLILPELRQTQGCFLMAWMSETVFFPNAPQDGAKCYNMSKSIFCHLRFDCVPLNRQIHKRAPWILMVKAQHYSACCFQSPKGGFWLVVGRNVQTM